MSKFIDQILKREKQEQSALRRIYFVRHEGVAQARLLLEGKSLEERRVK